MEKRFLQCCSKCWRWVLTDENYNILPHDCILTERPRHLRRWYPIRIHK